MNDTTGNEIVYSSSEHALPETALAAFDNIRLIYKTLQTHSVIEVISHPHTHQTG